MRAAPRSPGRIAWRARTLRTSMRLAMLLACGGVSTGCMSFIRGSVRSHDVAANGLSMADDAFRRSLVTGGYTSAFARARSPKTGAPDDALLRALYRGLTGLYAGELRESTAAFALADRLTEDRVTRSASRSAMSLVLSDAVLPFMPSRTERLMLHFYAMQAYQRAGKPDDALVEARKLGAALERVEARALSAPERALHATLRDAAGAMFESAGEQNDALVSYRNAGLLRGMSRGGVDSIRLARPRRDSATLVVLLESGFVAHRVDHGLTIALGPDSTVADSGWTDDESQPWSDRRGVDRPMHLGGRSTSFVRVAWPALVRGHAMQRDLSFLVRSVASQADVHASPLARQDADLSDALAADFRRDRPWMLSRAVARALAKGAATEALRDKHGEWAGVLASMAGSAIERADTRSWQLLPERLTVVRLVVPAGRQSAAVRLSNGDDGDITIRIPEVDLVAGETRVVSARVWRSGAELRPPVAAIRDTSAARLRTNR